MLIIRINHFVTEKVAALGSARLYRIWVCNVLLCKRPWWPHMIRLTSRGPSWARIWTSSKTLSRYFSAWPAILCVLVSPLSSTLTSGLYWLSACWIRLGISYIIDCISRLCLAISLQSSMVGSSCLLFSKREIRLSKVIIIRSLSVLKSSLSIDSKMSNPTPQARNV